MLEKGSRTIPELLKKAAKDFEAYRYLSYKTDQGWISYSYSEVYQNSLAIGASLKKIGIQKNDCIAIISEGSPMWVTSEHGIVCAAAISVPLSVKLLPEEIPYRFNHADVKAVFTSHNHLDKIIEIDYLLESNDMFVIYLDEDLEYFYKAIDKAGIRRERALSYWKLLAEGRSLLDADPKYLNDRLHSIKEDDVVNISYTSGTTGNPKGIMLTHLNYYSNAKDGTSVFRLEKGFRTLIILPIDHSFAHTVAIYGALFSALDIRFLDTRGGMVNALKNIPINLQEVKPQFLLTVPALSGNFIKKMKEGVAQKGALVNKLFENGLQAGHAIYGNGYEKTSGVKRLISALPYGIASTLIFKKLKAVFGGELQYMVGGGALLDIKQQQFYYYIGNPVFQGYGLTEAAPIISANTPFDHKLGTSGKIMPGIKCKIMKDDEHEAQAGEIGEIVIQGDNVMKGYYRNEEATKDCIRKGWLWTGDLGFMDEDDFLVVTGRNKALLISEDGEKYSPEGIEEAIVNCSEMIGQAMIYNDHKKFTSAVLTIDPLKLSKLKNKKPEEILNKVKGDMNRFKQEPAYQGQFPEKWTPSTLFIAPEPFSEDNKMINSTLKMVRHKITTHYQDEIDTMYGPEGQKMVNDLNIQSIRKIQNSKF
jgi:long-chain acyl-CoA synthetase